MTRETCCGQPKVLAIYLTSYTKSRTPFWVCREFVRRHPDEYEIVDAAAVDAALGTNNQEPPHD